MRPDFLADIPARILARTSVSVSVSHSTTPTLTPTSSRGSSPTRPTRAIGVISVASWMTRRHSRDDPRENVGVGVVECQLNWTARHIPVRIHGPTVSADTSAPTVRHLCRPSFTHSLGPITAPLHEGLVQYWHQSLHRTEPNQYHAVGVLARAQQCSKAGPIKVKFSHTRYRALGTELIPVYRQSART